jgi:hypothetical protein
MNSASEQSQKVVSSPLFCTFASVLTGQSRKKKLPVLCTYQRIADGTTVYVLTGQSRKKLPVLCTYQRIADGTIVYILTGWSRKKLPVLTSG